MSEARRVLLTYHRKVGSLSSPCNPNNRCANLERHVNHVRNHFGLPCVVSINHFTSDTPAEIELLKKKLAHHEAPVVVARHWAEVGAGAEELARSASIFVLIELHPGFIGIHKGVLYFKVLIESGRTECSLDRRLSNATPKKPRSR
jgi:hypothetical protein